MPEGDYEEGEVWDEPWDRVQGSSNVKAFRRSGVDGVDLDVVFQNAYTLQLRYYHYRGAGHEYQAMLTSYSKGKFTHSNLIGVYAADQYFPDTGEGYDG